MRKWILLSGLTLAATYAGTAYADEPLQGRWEIKLLGTGVLPDGPFQR